MSNVINYLGGRKNTLALVAMVLIALSRFLELTPKELDLIVWIALGGAATIAVEDSLRGLRSGNHKDNDKKD